MDSGLSIVIEVLCEPRLHEPVLLNEVLKVLEPQPGQVIIDATLGSGGHALEILKRIGSKGHLIAIDRDPDAIERAKPILRAFPQVDYVRQNFSELDKILECLNIKSVNAVILDVGLSTEQLEEAQRGFSFLKDGPLDMRMDPEGPVRAWDLVNGLAQRELETLFGTYGEERWAKRIAGAICRRRMEKPIDTTKELAQIVQIAVPSRFRFGPRHPATRVFQALRIWVNQELEALENVLVKVLPVLQPGGRLAVITFHSLEDRIVKRRFREWSQAGFVRILTRKPLRPADEEIHRNPRCRSAKLRAVEKVFRSEDQ